MRTYAVILVSLMLGCTNNAPATVYDFAMTSHDLAGVVVNDLSGAVTDGGGGTNKCATGYTASSIAGMRSAGAKGCFKFTGVVTLAVNYNSTTYVDFYVQDTAGGDYSAIKAECSTKSGDVSAGAGCLVDHNTAKSVLAGRSMTLSGFYNKTANGLEFFNVIDNADDTGTGTAPAALSVAAASATKGSALTAQNFYQSATITGGPFKMYDFAPVSETNGSFSACATAPSVFGFGIIPSSDSSDTPGGGCPNTDGGTPTAPSGNESASEIIVGTDIYRTFTGTTDCKCYGTGSTLYTNTTTFSALKGILIPQGSGPSFTTSVSPAADADLPHS